ncbi:MAG TPA: YraN family protein [Acidimicrobiales bacterium]|nr:YraN family protein [Acidimicrobiales bacterium]
MTAGRRATGAWGEQQVARWYEARGYQVLARNWRVREGELDLVVARDGVIAFCEVKSRSGAEFGQPFEAVTGPKQARLRRLAAMWLRADGRSWPVVRFDVASVVKGQVAGVIESAF